MEEKIKDSKDKIEHSYSEEEKKRLVDFFLLLIKIEKRMKKNLTKEKETELKG